jgi:REP element-mobilizing transposase RayT
MRRPDIAQLVSGALQYFAGDRYELPKWCVMPNHAHALVRPLGNHTLATITHSWKSYTANRANALLHRRGTFWQKESFDHLIRDERDFERAKRYITQNPVRAGLSNWQWIGP